MRKHLKKQIIEMADTIEQAHREVQGLVQQHDYEAAKGLLAECQQAALNIGNSIEESEGKGLKVISLLERYCDLLYQASLDLSGYESVWYKSLEKELSEIRYEIVRFIKETLEIAFLPYKASMWDCLESIWLAAKEDVDCQCFVVPIPYFDKEVDGTLGTMHCEADQFPDYVPVTSWEAYNLVEREPDIIYIHNPYDNDNHVTTIHPFFYCKELKKHTDMLVYIPYFVSMDDIPDNLCISAGTVYSDRVIVQSEAVRATYIEEYKKFLKDNHVENIFVKAEDKFLALGSPKIDKVLHTTMDLLDVPMEWQNKIREKRVVLYNTSIKELLMESENYVKKLKYVFDCFKKFSSTIVLLWRPHPLSNETCKALRPQLLEEYRKITAEYKEEGWGIYDDSPDVHRAIAISDAYYGDNSSLVPMYGVTGKPIMIQDLKFYDVEELSSLWVEDVVTEDDDIWFPAGNHNGLFKLDMNTKKLICAGRFPGESKSKRLYGNIVRYENKLVCTPLYADHIAVYDMETGEIESITVMEPDIKTTRYNGIDKFFATIAYKHFIYLIGASYPGIIRLNMKTMETDYFNDFMEQLEKYSNETTGLNFRKEVAVTGSTAFLPSRNSNVVMELDLENCEAKLWRIGDSKSRYNGICFDGSSYWITSFLDGTITRWDKGTDNISIIELFKKENDGCPSFAGTFFKNGFVWVFSQSSDILFKIEIDTEQVSKCLEFESIGNEPVFDSLKGIVRYFFVKCLNDEFMAYSTIHNRLLRYNFLDDTLVTYPVNLPARLFEPGDLGASSSVDKENNIYRENSELNVVQFINCLVDNKIFRNNLQIQKIGKYFSCLGDSGTKIHDCISSSIYS